MTTHIKNLLKIAIKDKLLYTTMMATSVATAISLEAPKAYAQKEITTGSSKDFDGFPAARNEILSLAGGAMQRIRVVTDFLTDGELVTALYIAQYRKVNVQVLLGQARATNVLSRLNYLKAQNVPVWLRPRGFMPQSPTVLLIDSKLYTLNADLDSMARHRRFTLTLLPEADVAKFVENFDAATSTGVSPSPKAMPLVGRPGGHFKGSHAYHRETSGSSGQQRPSNTVEADNSSGDSNNSTGAYRYNRVKQKPSGGVPMKLPKNTILQERARDREAANGAE